MSELIQNFPNKKNLHAAKCYDVSMVITAHYGQLRHQTCTKDFRKVSTTLQYPKYWTVTTSGIAGLWCNSIKYHTLDRDGTQKVVVGCFNLLHDAHHSWEFYGSRGNLRC